MKHERDDDKEEGRPLLENIFGKVMSDLSVITPDGRKFSRERMEEVAKKYRGVNRIHKQFLLLMWTDVKNGKRSNWEE
jgi:hypothetical protein